MRALLLLLLLLLSREERKGRVAVTVFGFGFGVDDIPDGLRGCWSVVRVGVVSCRCWWWRWGVAIAIAIAREGVCDGINSNALGFWRLKRLRKHGENFILAGRICLLGNPLANCNLVLRECCLVSSAALVYASLWLKLAFCHQYQAMDNAFSHELSRRYPEQSV